MKVAIITERANISLGGAERSVSELAQALSAVGHNVTILAAKGNPNVANVHILCQSTHKKRADYTAFSQAIQEHLRTNHYDIIHSVLPFACADVYQPRGGTYAESIVRNAASYENRLVQVWKRITATANFRRAKLLADERRLCQSQTGPTIAALSQYVAIQLEKHYRTPGQRVTVISNGVRTSRTVDANRAKRIRSQILTQLHLREQVNPVLLIFAANNFRLKGLAPLIRAMSFAADHKQQFSSYLVVVGRAPARKYIRLARKLRMAERIVFLGPVDNLQNVLFASDVAVLPTFYDPSSRFILEALTLGKPVITTRYNGARDLFENQKHGIVIGEPTDTSALANAIAYFSQSKNIAQASQAIIADNLIQNISISRVATELTQLYESLPGLKGKQ